MQLSNTFTIPRNIQVVPDVEMETFRKYRIPQAAVSSIKNAK